MIKITDIANTLAARHELSQADANAFVTALFSVIEDGLRTDDRQVKVKGLGTFKVTSVSPRESVDVNTGERIVIEGREKIVFTPDTVLRDRVNRTFAQFETVTLRDDVNFSEIDKAFEQTAPATEQTVSATVETPQKPEEETKTDTPPAPVEDNQPEPAVEEEKPKVEEEKPKVEEEKPKVEEEKTEEPKEESEDKADAPQKTDNAPQNDAPQCLQNRLEKMQIEEHRFSNAHHHISSNEVHHHDNGTEEEYDDEQPRNTLAIWLTAIIIVLLLIGGAGGGYLWHELSVRNDSIAILQTRLIDIEERIHHAKANVHSGKAPAETTTPTDPATKEKENVTPVSATTPTAPKANQAPEEKKTATATDYNKDVRIRTGAYKIVGIDKTVTVKAGQTLASIARSYLGPGMECYVEAVNENREYKAGDQVKLPKLELKKAAKKK